MSRSALGVVLGILAIVIVGALVFANSKDKDETATPNTSDQVESDNNSDSTANTSQPSGDQSTSQNSGTTQAATASIEIKDSAYSPTTITVKKGTKVTWTNQDSVQHDVNPDSDSANFEAGGLLSKGESYSYTFNTAGTYAYHCTPHPFMKATVVVTD